MVVEGGWRSQSRARRAGGDGVEEKKGRVLRPRSTRSWWKGRDAVPLPSRARRTCAVAPPGFGPLLPSTRLHESRRLPDEGSEVGGARGQGPANGVPAAAADSCRRRRRRGLRARARPRARVVPQPVLGPREVRPRVQVRVLRQLERWRLQRPCVPFRRASRRVVARLRRQRRHLPRVRARTPLTRFAPLRSRRPFSFSELCPLGAAWADVAAAPDVAHLPEVCSGRGHCDFTTGRCQCEPGTEGSACQRSTWQGGPWR